MSKNVNVLYVTTEWKQQNCNFYQKFVFNAKKNQVKQYCDSNGYNNKS